MEKAEAEQLMAKMGRPPEMVVEKKEIEVDGQKYRIALGKTYRTQMMPLRGVREGAEVFHSVDCGLGEETAWIWESVWVGYVDLDQFDLPEGFDYKSLKVHGGITGSLNKEEGNWIGFDCSHYGDYPTMALHHGGKLWTEEEVVDQCRLLVEQLLAVSKEG